MTTSLALLEISDSFANESAMRGGTFRETREIVAWCHAWTDHQG